MTIASMTGFSRTKGQYGRHQWTWETKSVNGRNLDIRVKVPFGYDHLELHAKKTIAKKLSRGSIYLTLSFENNQQLSELYVNHNLLKELIALHDTFYNSIAPEPPRLEALLNVKGVIEMRNASENDCKADQLEKAICATLITNIDTLIESRITEGEYLHTTIRNSINELTKLCSRAVSVDGAHLGKIQIKLKAQLNELLDNHVIVDPERLAQEVAILASKADVREELDRLKGHCSSGRKLLRKGKQIGRQLEFLCQELNREANTLCAKSSDEELTKIGLEMKMAIDQIREQAQNLE